jgi:pyridoxine kinase
MGSADIGQAILSTVARVREANSAALYCCDPVIGDVGRGVFVRPGIPEFMREHAVPAADIVTPNQFELEYLSGREIGSLADARRALDAVRAMGPRVVLVTSLHTDETPEDSLDLAAGEAGDVWRLRTPKLAVSVNGAGDAIAALFLVHYLTTRSARVALERAASSVYSLLKRTEAAGSREILTVAAQDEFVNPTRRFDVEEI